MENITIFGCTHSEGGEYQGVSIGGSILGPISDKLFAENYLPTLGEKDTLLVVEGGLEKSVFTIDHPFYESCISRISLSLAQSDFGPDILGADTRYRDEKSRVKFLNAITSLQKWIHKNASIILPGIGTAETIKHNILSGDRNYVMYFNDGVPMHIKNIARICIEECQRMEENMIATAQKYRNEYEQIFILAGAVHSFAMAQKHPIPFIFLEEVNTREEYVSSYTALLSSLVLKEMIVKY